MLIRWWRFPSEEPRRKATCAYLRATRSACKDVWGLVEVVIVLSFLLVCEIVPGVASYKQLHGGLSLATGMVGWPSPSPGFPTRIHWSCVFRVSARILERRLSGLAPGAERPDQEAENAC